MKPIKDTEYVFLSARIKAMEGGLLNEERMERMLEAPTHREAAKVLTECGYEEPADLSGSELERVLALGQQQVMEDLSSCAPDRRVVDLFRLRYDYHNAKALVKAAALGKGHEGLLLPGGRYDKDALAAAFEKEDLGQCSEAFRRAVARAREILTSSGDPQQADFVLDQACFGELSALAKEIGSPFLADYAALTVDIANLRAAVRAGRLGKGPDFLERVLTDGGTVSPGALCAAGGDSLAALFQNGPLSEAAAEGGRKDAPGSGSLTVFERLCDEAMTRFFKDRRRVSFGVEPLAGYLFAREAEATAIRIILSGRMAGLDKAIIRERLRECYV